MTGTQRTYVVAGSSGFIGTALVASLQADGHRVVRLVRRPTEHPDEVLWNPSLGATGASRELREALEGVHAVVNLAGAGIAEKRWDEKWKRAIIDSRVAATTCLATAIADTHDHPGVLVSASASGYYGDTGPDAVEEDAAVGSTFLARVCQAWEQSAAPAREAGVRVVHPRTGLVMAQGGGALDRLLPVVKLGAGGRLGSGKQWWSPISLADEVGALRHLCDTPTVTGPVNLVAPEQGTNAEITDALGRAVHRPTVAVVPGFALRIVLGEFADELLLDQRMSAAKLLGSGYEFRHPTVDAIVHEAVNSDIPVTRSE
ncbi:MAG: TIGR01777 family oxidoreductase [Candidatus Nanopelagicales bacterium]